MIITLILRVVQIVFAAIVLGASIRLIKDQVYGGAPATTGYSAFAGAWGMLTALVGVAAIWIEPLSAIIMVSIDGLAAILLVAAGIAWAVGLRHVSCGTTDPFSYAANAPLINGGCVLENNDQNSVCGYSDANDLRARCQLAEADTTFMFLAFLACVVLIVLGFLARNRGGGKSSMV